MSITLDKTAPIVGDYKLPAALPFKMGDTVLCSGILKRRQKGSERYWSENTIRVQEALCIGWRRLSDGFIDEDHSYVPSSYFYVYAIVLAENTNPVYAQPTQVGILK